MACYNRLKDFIPHFEGGGALRASLLTIKHNRSDLTKRKLKKNKAKNHL